MEKLFVVRKMWQMLCIFKLRATEIYSSFKWPCVSVSSILPSIIAGAFLGVFLLLALVGASCLSALCVLLALVRFGVAA